VTPGRSLFWTITGLFLLTVVVGSLIQAFVALAVLRPLELREARSRAELVLSNIASEIAASPQTLSSAAIDTILAHHRAQIGPRAGLFVFRGADGLLVVHPPPSPRLRAALEGDSTVASTSGGADGRNPPESRFETIAERPVQRASQHVGELQVLRPIRGRGSRDLLARTSLLFVPVAVLAAAIAGLVIVRLLVRRLRSLEILAARVAEGDLSVRIADTSRDEIGRLAEQLNRMTEKLAEARTRLEENDRQRRQLFADITHELATPLTSIRGYTETMIDPQVSVSGEERARYLSGVLDEANRLDHMIRDLFELARLEAGATALVKERLDWAALCHHTTLRFERRFAEAGLRLEWSGAAGEAWINADGRRLEQVLENLLNNALRYVPAGGRVEVALGRSADGAFRLTVSDDGPGLPADEQSRVFERFYRGSGATSQSVARDAGGSGLGLAIVREIVERHGGTVRAEQRMPHGLTMVIEIPASS
jgi:signal transduction histidine kinase